MKTIVILFLFCSLCSSALSQELDSKNNNYFTIEYLCADWGPRMLQSDETKNLNPLENAEDEIYFIKQLGSYTKGPVNTKGHGVDLYLCKMKSDGSNKTELRELWHQVTYPVDTQTQSTWMSINRSTHKIAISITLAGTDLTGLWTMNLDGMALRRVIAPTNIENRIQVINFPNWTPDGKWIIFAEGRRGIRHGQIAKCDSEGGRLSYLTNGPGDGQPNLSPTGSQIIYGLVGGTNGGFRLMDSDGSNSRLFLNPDSSEKRAWSGLWPIWSPDGNKILCTAGLIDVSTGKRISDRMPVLNGQPYTYGWGHWGKPGVIGYTVMGLVFTDSDLKKCKLLGTSRTIECDKAGGDQCRW